MGAAPPLAVIGKRSGFLAAAKGRKSATPSLVLQGRPRRSEEAADAAVTRVGFTCSKKVGNAVARNRAKRRLRAAASEVLRPLARPGWDYVLIGLKDATAGRAWPDLLDDLRTAVARVHGGAPNVSVAHEARATKP